jgi:hypothetical protein
MGKKRKAYRLLVGKPEGKNTKIICGCIIIKDRIGWGDVDWIGQAQDSDKWRALVNAVMNFWVP